LEEARAELEQAKRVAKAGSQNPCDQLREEKPATRAVGQGTNFQEQTARNIAEMQARASFVRAIATKIKAATATDSYGASAHHANANSESSTVSDQWAGQNDFATSIAEGVIRNTVVIKTYKELKDNNQYDVWVCLEYHGDIAKMAEEIAAQVQQQIPDSERMRMNFEFEQFRKRVEAELAKGNQ
jgi:uncharacterized alkaline shock family protein YloU